MAPLGVTANAIRAGVTDTPALRRIPGGPELHKRAVERNPSGRATTPEDVAKAIAQTTATLNGTVNPNGSTVTACTIEYGTSTSYGQSATCSPSPGSGSSAVAVSAAVTGLSANTTYDFRVVATNAGGTTKGSN